jgi:hypothetical protein
MFAIIQLLATFITDLFKSPRRLEVENLFLRHQLTIALRETLSLYPKAQITPIGCPKMLVGVQKNALIFRNRAVVERAGVHYRRFVTVIPVTCKSQPRPGLTAGAFSLLAGGWPR